MRHNDDVDARLTELRSLRPLLCVFEDEETHECTSYKILDKQGTPFWYAYFNSELDAREAWELWYALVKGKS